MAAREDLDPEQLDFGGVEPVAFARIVKGLPARRITELMSGPQRRPAGGLTHFFDIPQA